MHVISTIARVLWHGLGARPMSPSTRPDAVCYCLLSGSCCRCYRLIDLSRPQLSGARNDREITPRSGGKNKKKKKKNASNGHRLPECERRLMKNESDRGAVARLVRHLKSVGEKNRFCGARSRELWTSHEAIVSANNAGQKGRRHVNDDELVSRSLPLRSATWERKIRENKTPRFLKYFLPLFFFFIII